VPAMWYSRILWVRHGRDLPPLNWGVLILENLEIDV